MISTDNEIGNGEKSFFTKQKVTSNSFQKSETDGEHKRHSEDQCS